MTADAAFSEYVGIFEAEQQRKATPAERAELRARLDAGRPPLDSLRLLTVAEYAEREHISTQAVYKRINAGKLRAVTVSAGDRRGRCVLVSTGETGAENDKQTAAEDYQGAASPAADRERQADIMSAELEQLRAENERLKAQLDEERAASRAQSDRILSLAERLADLTAASQILLQQQQQKAGALSAHDVTFEPAEVQQEQPIPPADEQQATGTATQQDKGEHTSEQGTVQQQPPQAEQKKGFFARLFGL